MSVNVGEPAYEVAGIVHRGRLRGEESGRYRQLLNHWRAARIRNVIFPGDRQSRSADNETVVVDCRFANYLTAQRTEDHAAGAPQEPARSRAQRAIAAT